jgi:hypothetical protein
MSPYLALLSCTNLSHISDSYSLLLNLALILALTSLISVIPALFSYPALILALTSVAYHSAIIFTLTSLNSLISALTSYSVLILALTSLISLICALTSLTSLRPAHLLPSPYSLTSSTTLIRASYLSLSPHSCSNLSHNQYFFSPLNLPCSNLLLSSVSTHFAHLSRIPNSGACLFHNPQ